VKVDRTAFVGWILFEGLGLAVLPGGVRRRPQVPELAILASAGLMVLTPACAGGAPGPGCARSGHHVFNK